MADEKVEEVEPKVEEEKPKPKRRRRKKKVEPKEEVKASCPEGCDGSCEDCDREDCECKKESMEMVEPKGEEMVMVDEPPRNIYRERVPTTARKLAGIKKEKDRKVHKYLGKVRRL